MIEKAKLKELKKLLNQDNIDKNNLSKENLFRLEFCKSLANSFINYDIESITFDFEALERISNVWEGSSEDILYLRMNKEYSSFAYLQIYQTIAKKFDYLTEDSSYLKTIADSGNTSFYEFTNNELLTEQIYSFLGEAKSYLLYLSLEKINSNSNNISNNKRKI
jgi:hypothetical protein